MNFTKEQFSRAIELWSEWNTKINVVSRKDIDCRFEHHILHSLAIAEYLDRFGLYSPPSSSSVLDVGCGGGFPGIPLAIVMPDAGFTLCDSIGKKIRVAQAVADGLGLGNVRCVNARAETLPEKYDWVVSRAVTGLENFYHAETEIAAILPSARCADVTGGNDLVVFDDDGAVVPAKAGASFEDGFGDVKIVIDFVTAFTDHAAFSSCFGCGCVAVIFSDGFQFSA